MKALVSDTWSNALGALVILLITWALFVVPTGPRWAGYVWVATVALMVVTVSVLYTLARPAVPVRPVLDRVAREALHGRGRRESRPLGD